MTPFKLKPPLGQKKIAELDSSRLPASLDTVSISVREWLRAFFWRLKENRIAILAATFCGISITPWIIHFSGIWPQGFLALLLGGVSGACLMALVLLTLQAVDRSIHTLDETEKILGFPVLIAIPRAAKLPAGDAEVLKRPNSPTAEEFRRWRLLLASSDQEQSQIILITSTRPSEGKSYCSANLAITLAHAGEPTLLLEADLRRPSLSTYFPAFQGPTLGEYLHSPSPQISIPEVLPHLSFLPGGQPQDSPADLLSSPATPALLQKLRQQFRWIIIDSPPLAPVSDTLILAQYTDDICFVVRRAMTSRVMLKRAMDTLRRIRVRPRLLILNDMPEARDTRVRGYYYASSAIAERAGEIQFPPK